MLFAYQGEPGAFSEAAAARLDPSARTMPCREFEDVFAAVISGAATHAVLPMENSVGGSIHRNYDLLSEHELPIVGEVELLVEHTLCALPGVPLDQIRRVYSHPQALAQCERFLRSLHGVDIVATYDTAGSARMIQEGDLRDTAAIASRRAAEIFGLSVLRDGVQDFDVNITRFIVIARDPLSLGKPDKTSLVFALPNAPGSLFKALSVFALREIDLAKLESRPLRGRPWEYLFYVDLNASREEPHCARAIEHLGEFATYVRLLGSYGRHKDPVKQRDER